MEEQTAGLTDSEWPDELLGKVSVATSDIAAAAAPALSNQSLGYLPVRPPPSISGFMRTPRLRAIAVAITRSNPTHTFAPPFEDVRAPGAGVLAAWRVGDGTLVSHRPGWTVRCVGVATESSSQFLSLPLSPPLPSSREDTLGRMGSCALSHDLQIKKRMNDNKGRREEEGGKCYSRFVDWRGPRFGLHGTGRGLM